MRVFSMWEFRDIINLEDAVQKVRQAEPIYTPELWDDDPLVAAINEIEEFPLTTPVTIEIDGERVPYIFFEAYSERSKRQDAWYSVNQQLKPRSDRINLFQSRILLFEYNNTVKGIVFTGVNRAKTLINDTMPPEIWGIIEPAELHVTEDLLYWIFKKFIDLRDRPLSSSHDLYVTALKSYAGKTRDNINAMRGNGRRISTILGTLAFLFNNENLKAVRPQLQHNGEVFLIEISLTGTCRIWEEEYQGGWLFEENEKLINNIAIYSYIKLLPMLIDCYRENIVEGLWSPQLKIEFLQRLGNEIKDQVEAELVRLQNEINPPEETEDDGEEVYEMFDVDESEDDID
jgi:hypothetical protein